MNEKEFAEIVKKTKGVVLSSIQKHLPARFLHVIDDIVQETYLRAYKAIIKNKFRGDSSMETWLYVIAKNESLRLSKQLIREEEKIKKARELIINSNKTQYKNNDFEENKAQEIKKLKELINKLPKKYKSVLKLYAAGYSEKEIAKYLSTKRGTVKSRASRGRELLQRIANGGGKI